MRIGIDGRAAKWYRGTGIGTYTYQLINCLNKIDRINNYTLFMPQDCKFEMTLRRNFQLNDTKDNRKDNFWDDINTPNILEDEKIQLYHIPQNGIGLPSKKNCKFIITLHDVIPYRMPETVSDRYLKLFSEYIPKIIPKCDGIITVSNFSKSDIIKAFDFPEDKIYVTPLASEDIYRPLDKRISRYIAKKYYSIEGDFILYVGGFSPRKNIIGTIKSFKRFISLYKKPINLVIVGNKGKSYALYKKCTEKLNIQDRVMFPGFISINHLPYIYNASKLFLYPSFYEGFGLPTIEAMACGTPVITSNRTSMPEVVGKGALLIDPENDVDLCNAMLNVLSDKKLYENLSRSGLYRSSQFSWKKTAERTLNIYDKIINER
ncbi:MAG: glycosyltransferase family 4 protein [Clostridium sp.]|uniref:glycosyltransferase family 4 protein n=1 Tax=Clostridium sp. TaxID=1506 RepID=UPI0025C69D54|nr:glycosyltransferase family 1 protein [Clostridium sp.]MCH3965325.1 glycosyltransferase family 4 protein [Clostridium sp.]MCI1714546.1 glycosyltransferase family 4 protein [Clostridium sp.]MCI1798808.1 glycosyltransferase family 4 protein [Clostridium sp.]MCI1812461.1 glycosyltransferase family 4 protein [Clostridium sp.]MCI1869618.1 glycosyltransferase family 4 protein [Clostridium sp.]